MFNINPPIAASIFEVPKPAKSKGNFNSDKFYGVLLTFSPAAADTISSFLNDTGTAASDYDLILTGDLGFTGSDLLLQLLKRQNIILPNHNDCGMMIFDRKRQDVHSGGSGCGCSASVLCSYVLQKMTAGELKNVLFCATGALMSPTACMQGESIPSIAHLIHLSI